MRYTLKDLIVVYATYNEMTTTEAKELYEDDRISKYDLLESYLHNEGILGYTPALWSIFESLFKED